MITSQNTDNTEIWLWWTNEFYQGYIRWVKGYLQEKKWLGDSGITKVHPSMSDISQKLGTWKALYCATCRKLNRLVGCPGWSDSHPDSSAGLCFFQAVYQAWTSSQPLSLSGTISQQTLILINALGKWGPSESGQFWELPEVILNRLLTEFNKLLWRMEYFTSPSIIPLFHLPVNILS